MDYDNLREALMMANPADLPPLLDRAVGNWTLEPWPGLHLWQRGIAVVRAIDAARSGEIQLPIHRVRDSGVIAAYAGMLEVRDAAVAELSRTSEWFTEESRFDSLADAIEKALGHAYVLQFTMNDGFRSGQSVAQNPGVGLIVSASDSDGALASILTQGGDGWTISGGRMPLFMTDDHAGKL